MKSEDRYGLEDLVVTFLAVGCSMYYFLILMWVHQDVNRQVCCPISVVIALLELGAYLLIGVLILLLGNERGSLSPHRITHLSVRRAGVVMILLGLLSMALQKAGYIEGGTEFLSMTQQMAQQAVLVGLELVLVNFILRRKWARRSVEFTGGFSDDFTPAQPERESR